MRKIAVVTGSRAEYGLLYFLMKEILSDKGLRLQLIVTGTHLSAEFGLTYREIEKDGFQIDRKVELILSSDTPIAISKSMALGLIGFAEAFAELRPDIVVILGDRFEIFAAVTAALICRIPVAHIGGGDSSEGAIDESMRNSITKMSHLHFTMLESHRRRLIQLGEDPERIFNVGSLSIDNIKNTNLLKKNELENALSFKLGKKNLLVTFHPCTLENSTAESQFKNLLSVLSEMPDVRVIFTKPNADTEGRVIIDLINNYVARHKNNCICVDSLGARVYLSALQFVDAVVGNSSSGIVEAPSFKIASINIGDRQRGRARAGSIIDCQPTRASLGQAFNKVYSPGFRRGLSEVKNPYDKGSAAKAIKGILKKHNLEGILKKKFFELWVNSNEQGRNRN